MLHRSIAVYCGSSTGNNPAHSESAKTLGRVIAERECALIYGGGNVGLMGILADAALEAGGQVIGVMPRLLIEKEIAHSGLTELHSVESMSERKQKMMDLADAFIALPGGLGTLEEIFEAFTWLQLGIHRKPCGLLNGSGFYNLLIQFLENLVHQGFVLEDHLNSLLVDDNPDQLVTRLRKFNPAHTDKWIKND